MKHKENSRLTDMTGQRFGRLVVERLGGRSRSQRATVLWRCRCDCGGTVYLARSALVSGNTRSCGCLKREEALRRLRTHGKTGSRVYSIWANMITRCTNNKSGCWEWYGGRGVAVCARWRTFANFYADMGDPPDGFTLERKNNNKGYEPSNCIWLAAEQQNLNRRSCTLLTLDGKTQPVTAWATELGINVNTLLGRLRLGWSVERALMTPVSTKGQYDRSHLMGKRKVAA